MPPSEKMNVACIGVGGMQGGSDVGGVSGENIYALCDVDETFLAKAAEKFPKAKLYRDFREMLDKEPSIEAVFIATPDFMHAPYSRLCLEKGKHVYCEKMMSNTIEGARDMVRAGKANPAVVGEMLAARLKAAGMADAPGSVMPITSAWPSARGIPTEWIAGTHLTSWPSSASSSRLRPAGSGRTSVSSAPHCVCNNRPRTWKTTVVVPVVRAVRRGGCRC